MPRKSANGRFIISAGEVGEFVICPESWRLRRLSQGAQKPDSRQRKAGMEAHDSWSDQIFRAATLVRIFRYAFTLLIAMVVIFIFLKI